MEIRYFDERDNKDPHHVDMDRNDIQSPGNSDIARYAILYKTGHAVQVQHGVGVFLMFNSRVQVKDTNLLTLSSMG